MYLLNPQISPGFVARPDSCCEMRCSRPEGRGVVLDSTLRRAFGACVSPPSARVRWARLGANLRPLCAAVSGESSTLGPIAADRGRAPAAAEIGEKFGSGVLFGNPSSQVTSLSRSADQQIIEYWDIIASVE